MEGNQNNKNKKISSKQPWVRKVIPLSRLTEEVRHLIYPQIEQLIWMKVLRCLKLKFFWERVLQDTTLMFMVLQLRRTQDQTRCRVGQQWEALCNPVASLAVPISTYRMLMWTQILGTTSRKWWLKIRIVPKLANLFTQVCKKLNRSAVWISSQRAHMISSLECLTLLPQLRFSGAIRAITLRGRAYETSQHLITQCSVKVNQPIKCSPVGLWKMPFHWVTMFA